MFEILMAQLYHMCHEWAVFFLNLYVFLLFILIVMLIDQLELLWTTLNMC